MNEVVDSSLAQLSSRLSFEKGIEEMWKGKRRDIKMLIAWCESACGSKNPSKGISRFNMGIKLETTYNEHFPEEHMPI